MPVSPQLRATITHKLADLTERELSQARSQGNMKYFFNDKTLEIEVLEAWRTVKVLVRCGIFKLSGNKVSPQQKLLAYLNLPGGSGKKLQAYLTVKLLFRLSDDHDDAAAIVEYTRLKLYENLVLASDNDHLPDTGL